MNSLTFKRSLVVFCLVVGLCILLLGHEEIGGETWLYWLSARIYSETGRFVIFERSPIYGLYLDAFRWLGYPLETTVEYIMTTVMAVAAIILLFRRYIGFSLAAFAALLWMPSLQSWEPPVQTMALTFSFLAFFARTSPHIKNRLPIFYALAGIAYMFRVNYSVFILPFAVWDIWEVLKRGGLKGMLGVLRPQWRYWPVILVLFLSLWIVLMQSPHRWNNAWFSETRWFPTDGKSLRDSSFIQVFSWEYIQEKYGTFEGKDFYFITPEIFGDAKTIPAAIIANPRFVAEQIGRNLKNIAVTTSSLTLLPWVSKAPQGYSLKSLSILAGSFLYVIFILYGAFRASTNKEMALFVLGNFLIYISTLLSLPKWRYMFPLIPIVILSASWYGSQLKALLEKRGVRKLGFLATPFFLLLITPGDTDWIRHFKHLGQDIRSGEIRILQERPDSMKATFTGPFSAELKSRLEQCRGVMALEYTFLAAFTKIPLEKIYDVWEIPPFGKQGDSTYNGLRPDRIDCILVSKTLETDIGFATNSQIRFVNHIYPYTQELLKKGGHVYDVPGYGRLYMAFNPEKQKK